MTNANLSQVPILAASVGQPVPRASLVVRMAVTAPPQSAHAAVSQAARLAPYSTGEGTVPSVSQVAVMAVYQTGVPDPARKRAWTFTLDGHTFYVIDLGPEGTFAYDVITKQWVALYTQGFGGQWNFSYGVMWGDRIVGSDLLYSYVWELDPNQTLDEGWRTIMHVVTGGIASRSRDSIGCSQFTVSGSVGQVQTTTPVPLTLSFSDDNGSTWSPDFVIEIAPGATNFEISYGGLGSFSTPGRIFQLTDSGGMLRIDGADVELNGFDDTPPGTEQSQ